MAKYTRVNMSQSRPISVVLIHTRFHILMKERFHKKILNNVENERGQSCITTSKALKVISTTGKGGSGRDQ